MTPQIQQNKKSEPRIKRKIPVKMAEPVNLGILAQPSVYSHTMDEDIREFLHQFENESVANDWDDGLKMKKIRIAFRGVALNLFDEKIKDFEPEPGRKIETWDEMKKRILKVLKKNAALLRKKLNSRQYEGELDFFEYTMFVTKVMKEINPEESESKIVSKICDGLPLAERDYIWRKRPQNLDELNREFSYWLEHKEKMKRQTESEKDKDIERLTIEIEKLKKNKESTIGEVVHTVIANLGIVPQLTAQQMLDVQAQTAQQTLNTPLPPNSPTSASQISAEIATNTSTNTAQIPINALSFSNLPPNTFNPQNSPVQNFQNHNFPNQNFSNQNFQNQNFQNQNQNYNQGNFRRNNGSRGNNNNNGNKNRNNGNNNNSNKNNFRGNNRGNKNNNNNRNNNHD